MLSKTVIVKNKLGIHARPAAIIAKLAQKYQCNIGLIYQQQSYNAKKIMEVSSANIKGNEKLEIQCQGIDETQAITALKALFEDSFGED